MASLFLRRSGISVGLIAELLEWRADAIYQVGIGGFHQEVDVLNKEWPGVKWYGCEPHPAIVQALRDYPGAVHQTAIGNRVGEAALYGRRNHKDGASLYGLIQHDPGESFERFTVPVTTLDVLFGKPPERRVLLWLDCEGSELDALEGGEEFVQGVQMINVEMTSKPHGNGWGSPVDINRWLRNRGFWLQWIHTQRSSAGQSDLIYVRPELFNPEYCCVPHEVERWMKRDDGR